MLDEIVDELDLYELFHSHSHLGRKSVTHPRALLKIFLYANMERIYSTRAIESSCKRDIDTSICNSIKMIDKDFL